MSDTRAIRVRKAGIGRAPATARHQLALIALVQICAMSLWFSASAVVPALRADWGLSNTDAALLTAAVQVGFVVGALLSAVLNLADRSAPPRLIAASAILGAAATALFALLVSSLGWAIVLRFVTGVALAGVYPVGMKLVATWYKGGRGTALGVMVAALTVGSALPHLLTTFTVPSWRYVLAFTALLSLLAAAVSATRLRPGPEAQAGARFEPSYLLQMFSDRRQRRINFGYFGHMWELYAFIVLVPLILSVQLSSVTAISAAAFWVIGAGFAGCVGGGLLVRRWGSARVAQGQLACSAACCLLSPWLLGAPFALFMVWLLVWGATVAGDSPQFSALTAQNAPPAVVGSVLTLTNCIGFLISVLTIQLFVAAAQAWPLAQVLPWLAVGPLAGLWMMRPLLMKRSV